MTGLNSKTVTVEVQDLGAREVIEVVAVGPAGPNAVGGFGFEIQELQAGDLLRFRGDAWANAAEINLTDGGNF